MALKIGQKVKSDMSKDNLTVVKKIGSGGQGIVYLVEKNNKKYALKWYNLEQSTDEQKVAIRKLVTRGPPKEDGGKRFIWPIDLVTVPGSKHFGYLMPLIDTNKYATLKEIQAKLKDTPQLSQLCEISYQLANTFRELHLSGYCYRDISDNNLMFDPVSGDCLICDNDNIGVDNNSKSQILGTMEYMAPEIIRGEAPPSTNTDRHSLAVLLFNLWMWHHPFHGELEYNIRVFDIPAKKKIYGHMPIFIFDPADSRNHLPNHADASYSKWVHKRWEKICPKSLQDLFITAFTAGLKDSNDRIKEGQWQKLFLKLKDGAISCPNCNAENIWEPNTTLNCWNCSTKINSNTLRLICNSKSSDMHYLMLRPNTFILMRHVNKSKYSDKSIVGQIVKHPNKKGTWGIRNLTEESWSATSSNGNPKEVAPQKSITLTRGLKLKIDGNIVEIV